MDHKITEIKRKINAMPVTSGVYLMKNRARKVIYAGKAVNLRRRVQSYFRPAGQICSKTDLMVSQITDIDYIETASEAEALILEASLIKKHNPKYNVELKDNKSYPYIEITGEDFPRISIERPHVKNKKSKYYGPYVKAWLVREALGIIRKIFPYRTCHPFPSKECLDYHIGLCDAPCIGKTDKKNYAQNIRHVRLILEGKKDVLYRKLKKDMEAFSRTHSYEQAAKTRDQLRAIGALYSGTKDINYYKEAEQLKRAIGLSHLPERIETFDISNIMGQQAVGSMVSFHNGKPDKRNYRRFRVKEVEGIDDFKMITEVVRRRYRRLRNEGLTYPDLIVIDGGKGQLSAALGALQSVDVDIPVIALAKRQEDVYLPKKRDALRLAADSLGLKLLQRMRDEAHRFAVSYHKTLRTKEVFGRLKKSKSGKRSKD